MKHHYPYKDFHLEFDIQRRARGEKPTCPDCNWADPPRRTRALFELVPPRQVNGRTIPGYRFCKVCGFVQYADGVSAPHRCWLSRHWCDPPQTFLGYETSYTCRDCGRALTITEGVVEPHGCGKYLKEEQDGYVCSTCRQWFGRESKRPLPREGSR